jgi:hypothetical protein
MTKQALIDMYVEVLDGDLGKVLKTLDSWIAEHERIEAAWERFKKHDLEIRELIEGLRDA